MGEIITHDSLETLQSLFVSGVNRYDTTKEPIPGLGFGISIWNGKGSNDAASLSIRCGIDYPSIRLSNSVLISLPSSYDVNDLSAIRSLIFAFEESWCPDSIRVASSDSVDAHEIGEHFLDIALFLKSSLEDQFEPPPGAISVAMDRGTLFLRG
nr:hypothetical protein [Amantichitinum ursilacus]